jgi:hypothetical protein
VIEKNGLRLRSRAINQAPISINIAMLPGCSLMGRRIPRPDAAPW